MHNQSYYEPYEHDTYNKFLSIIIKKICYAMHFLLMIGVYHQTDDENMIVNPLSLSTKPSHQIDWKILKSRQSHAEDYIGWHGKVSTISFHQFFLNNCYFCKMDSCGEGCKLHDDVLCTQSFTLVKGDLCQHRQHILK